MTWAIGKAWMGGRLPQMTFLNEDLASYNKTMMGLPSRGKTGVHSNTDQWKKDIDRQVHTWMKNKPVLDSQRLSPHPLLSPAFDGSRKRRQKRHRLRDADDSTMDTTDSVTGGSESLVSVSTDHTRHSGSDIKPIQTSIFPKTNLQPKGGKMSTSSDDLLDTSERVLKQHGNAYNEIEYQKRYRRIFDLKKHLQFVNSTCLSGQTILKKNQRLPPMNSVQENLSLNAPDLLAISSVQKHNEPESVVRYPAPTLITTTQLTTHISPTKDVEDHHQSNSSNDNSNTTTTTTKNNNNTQNSQDSSAWQHTNRKPELNVYDKLPRITGKGQKRPGAEQPLTMSEYRVLRETEIRNKNKNKRQTKHERKPSVIEEVDSKCNTHRSDYDETQEEVVREGVCETRNGEVTPGEEQMEISKGESSNRNYEEKSDYDNEEDDDNEQTTPGMKIRIHIKYKRDLDDTSEGSRNTENATATYTSDYRTEGQMPAKHKNKKRGVWRLSE